MRSRVQLVYGVVAVFALILFIFQGIPALDARRGLAMLATLDATVKPSPDSRRILILQHMPGTSLLDRASKRSHEVYARAWGYRYEGVPHKLATTQQLHPSFNKLFVLQDALTRELKKNDGAQWILYADADTVVTDPSVPLHLLLPPSNLTPAPYLLGSQDDNGFNSGVFLIRVVDLMLDLIADIIDNGKAAASPAITERHFFGNTLRDESDFSDHFYEIPKLWLNAHVANEGEGDWSPQLHVHVNHLKKKYSFRPLVQASRNVYRMAARLAHTQGDQGSGLTFLPQHGKTAAHAREWWSRVKGGIMDIRFLDETTDKIVDYKGEVLDA